MRERLLLAKPFPQIRFMSEFSIIPPYIRPTLERYVSVGGEEPKFTAHGAFPHGSVVRYELRLPHSLMPHGVAMYIWHESGSEAVRYDMTRVCLERGADLFSVTLDMADVAGAFSQRVGLFYYGFDFLTRDDGKVGVRQSGRDGLPELRWDDFADGAFALTIYERKYPAPKNWYGGIIYHIFVDRFASSGKTTPKPYAKMADWNGGITEFPEYPGAPLANETFFGGDLYGIRDKLDYIASLGVTTIYLSPVFDAHSNHKYDTGDYERIDSMFGGKRALDSLLRAAEKRGIKVVFDGVFNHTGSDSKYFNREGSYEGLGAYRSEKSKYYRWFSFSNYPDEYESWWGIKILPRVNSRDPSYIRYISGEGGIVDTYTEEGVSGWRLDVVDELSDEFVDALVERVHIAAEKRGGEVPLVIGEVWEDASCKIAYGRRRRYFTGAQLDSVMNYPVRSALIEFLMQGDARGLTLALSTIWEHYPREIVHAVMNLLGTHDTMRIITVLAGDPSEWYTNAELAKKRMTPEQYARGSRLVKLGYMINATIPGIPSIYYGDEAGVEGYSDPFNRLPFPWGKEDVDMLSFFRKMGAVRRENNVYRDGELYLCRFDIDGFFMFGRGDGDVTLYTAVNRGDGVVTLDLYGKACELLIECGDVTNDEDGRILLPPMSGAVIKTEHGMAVSAESAAG